MNHVPLVGHAPLAGVLPAAALALGVDLDPDLGPDLGLGPDPDPGTGQEGRPGLQLPGARNVVVVLVDGLGDELLARRGGHAPFLRRLRSAAEARTLVTGFPSTTASSLGSFGTGLDVGAHGLVGTDVMDPARGVLFNELAWDPQVDPERWQPMPTVFERLSGTGVDVVHVGPAFMAGSGLTAAVLRGARFLPATQLRDRVDAALSAVKTPGRTLAYVYWGELDKTGHVHGCDSWQWGDELTAIDAELARLCRTVPRGTLVVVTADHGMVDIPFPARMDVAHEPDLRRGVRVVGGEPRAVQVYCEPGEAESVAARWRARFADTVTIRTREQALAEGWFGPVRPGVEQRIGDVVASAVAGTAIVDSRTMRPNVLRLLGLHGAATEAESVVPLLVSLA